VTAKKKHGTFRVEKKNFPRECPGEDECEAVTGYLEAMLASGWDLVSVDQSLFVFRAVDSE
jgi:hypothetical protein